MPVSADVREHHSSTAQLSRKPDRHLRAGSRARSRAAPDDQRRGAVRSRQRARCTRRDASNYRQVPIGVVVPTTKTMCGPPSRRAGRRRADSGAWRGHEPRRTELQRRRRSRLHEVHEPDPRAESGERIARVQPGRRARHAAQHAPRQHHLTFGPDPSTHSRCSLGGMIGNNSCGTHSLLAGKTVDNVHELRILLYDGTELTVGRNDGGRARRHRHGRADGAARSTPRCDRSAIDIAHQIRGSVSADPAPRLGLQPRSAAARERIQRRARARWEPKARAPSCSKRRFA